MPDLEAYEDYLLEKEHHDTLTSSMLHQKLSNKIVLDADYLTTLLNPKLGKNRGCESDRANRAVLEQVLDSRTMAILCKLIMNGHISSVNGCISTGKEANVYHASCNQGNTQNSAIKIYKSTILTFKNRDRYVQGEYRWRHGYCKHNPRKMVQMWAEKEMRNLKRLEAASIPCPSPRLLKLHVLLMDFIGDEETGIPAPRLKDVSPDVSICWKSVYYEAVRILRTLFHTCHLVHADFSEYNVLWHKDHLVVIDVGQAVEHEHPRAMDFLRSDCANVVRFFGRERGVPTMSTKQLFHYITAECVNADLDEVHSDCTILLGKDEEQTEQEFMAAHIPRTLAELPSEGRITMQEQKLLTERLASSMVISEPVPDVDQLTDVLEQSFAWKNDSVVRDKESIRAERKLNKTQVKLERRERRIQKKLHTLEAKGRKVITN